jgi:hypothetical protein
VTVKYRSHFQAIVFNHVFCKESAQGRPRHRGRQTGRPARRLAAWPVPAGCGIK